jgi:hypothetical protein
MNRDAFVSIMRSLLAEFAEDHEEHTGVTEKEMHPFDFWIGEISNLAENTR